VGSWQLTVDSGQLAVGSWQLAAGSGPIAQPVVGLSLVNCQLICGVNFSILQFFNLKSIDCLVPMVLGYF